MATASQRPSQMLPGRLGPDADRRHVTYPGPAGKMDRDGGRQRGWTAVDWSVNKARSRSRETPKFAASGALDLSTRRSTVDEPHPASTGPTSSKPGVEKQQQQQSEQVWRWAPALKGMRSAVKRDATAAVDRPPLKQISCPVCGKVFNAHYNLTRHMPVHTGARPFVCKVSHDHLARTN